MYRKYHFKIAKKTHVEERSTFTYMVEGFLAAEHRSLRSQVLSRYPAFVQNLLTSPSKGIRLLANIVARDS